MKQLSLYNKIAFLILCLGLFSNWYFFLPVLTITRVATLALLVGMFFVKRPKLDNIFYVVAAFFFMYVTYTLLISLWHSQYLTYSNAGNHVFILLLIIPTLWLFCAYSKETMRIFYYACCVFLVVSAILAVVEIITGWHLPMSNMFLLENKYIIPEDTRNSPTGFFYNTNDFAIIVTMALCYILSYRKLISAETKIWKDILFVILGLLTICLTHCRTALFIIVFFVLFMQRNIFLKYKRILLILLAVLVIAAIVAFFAIQTESTWVRANLYLYSFLSLFDSYCLGYGLEGDMYYYANMDNYNLFGHIINIHSYLLHFMLTSGVVFFMGYIVLLVYIMRKIAENHGRNEFWCMIPLYVLLLFAPSSSNFLWPHYVFFCSYIGYACLPMANQGSFQTEIVCS